MSQAFKDFAQISDTLRADDRLNCNEMLHLIQREHFHYKIYYDRLKQILRSRICVDKPTNIEEIYPIPPRMPQPLEERLLLLELTLFSLKPCGPVNPPISEPLAFGPQQGRLCSTD